MADYTKRKEELDKEWEYHYKWYKRAEMRAYSKGGEISKDDATILLLTRKNYNIGKNDDRKMLDFLYRLQNTDIWDHITLQYELLRIYLLGKAIVDSVLDGTFYRSVPFVFDGGQDTFYHPYVEFKGVVYRTIEGSDYFDEER